MCFFLFFLFAKFSSVNYVEVALEFIYLQFSVCVNVTVIHANKITKRNSNKFRQIYMWTVLVVASGFDIWWYFLYRIFFISFLFLVGNVYCTLGHQMVGRNWKLFAETEILRTPNKSRPGNVVYKLWHT